MVGRAAITIHLEASIPEGTDDPNIWFDKYMEAWAEEHGINFDETVEIDASVDMFSQSEFTEPNGKDIAVEKPDEEETNEEGE